MKAKGIPCEVVVTTVYGRNCNFKVLGELTGRLNGMLVEVQIQGLEGNKRHELPLSSIIIQDSSLNLTVHTFEWENG